MIPATFEYQRATSVDDAIAKLGAEGSKAVAGGHSLIPAMKLRLSTPSVLVDIARIPGIAGIREVGGAIEVGAGTTHHSVATSELLQRACPAVAEAAGGIGDQQVRNRGTIGGNIAHADPAADYPAVMLALDAEFVIKGPKGERTVKASSFFKDLFTTDLGPQEILVAVRFAPVKTAAYAKLHQRASHFPIVGVAVALDLKGKTIQSARVGITGAGPFATRLTQVEKTLAGQPASAETLANAAAQATLDDVNSDIHASAEYRRAMIRVFTRRALDAAVARA